MAVGAGMLPHGGSVLASGGLDHGLCLVVFPETSVHGPLCFFLVVIYLFQPILGLKHLDVSGYNKA
jgi:hypothetical protein